MSDILAYQIGAVFFLVVLFMAGTMTRSIFPAGLFRNIKLTVLAVVVLLVGFFAYHSLPDMSNIFSLDFLKPGGTAQAPASAPVAEPATAAVPARRSSVARPAAKMGEVKIIRPFDDEPEPVVKSAGIPIPAVADPPASTVAQVQPAPQAGVVVVTREAPSEGRFKRAAKSLGRLIGIKHEQYQPSPSVPQNVSAP